MSKHRAVTPLSSVQVDDEFRNEQAIDPGDLGMFFGLSYDVFGFDLLLDTDKRLQSGVLPLVTGASSHFSNKGALHVRRHLLLPRVDGRSVAAEVASVAYVAKDRAILLIDGRGAGHIIGRPIGVKEATIYQVKR